MQFIRPGKPIENAFVESRAQESGATILEAPHDVPFGERQYTARDLGGHWWTFPYTSQMLRRRPGEPPEMLDREAAV